MKNIYILFCFLFSINLCFSSGPILNKSIDNNFLIDYEKFNVSIKTTKDVYNENEEITVTFSGLPGNNQDWITLIKPNAPNKEYGNWKYTKGKESGTLTFDGMREGDYEVRVFFNNDYTIQARYPFKVIKKKANALEGNIENSPARNDINSLIEKLDELEKLKNSTDWGNERTMMKYYSFLETAPFNLQNVKSSDPNFDVSAFEKRLKDYQSYYDTNLSTVNDKNSEKADFEKSITDKSWKLTNLLDDRLGSGAGWVHSYFNTSNYLKEATEIDYSSLLKIAIEGDIKFKGHNLGYKVKTIKEFGSAYKIYYDNTLDKVINGLIEGAYEYKTTNAQDAVKYAAQAKQLSDAALLIMPNDPVIKSLNKEATTTLEKIGGEVFAKVYTSDFHKNNLGKVVFFNKKPTIKSENSSTVNNTYKAGDFIYAMAYLKGSFKDLASARNNIKVTTSIYVDGSKKTSHEFGMTWATLKEDKTYLFMEIIPNPATNIHSGPAKFASALAKISPRNHEIKVTLSGVGIGLSNVIHFAEGTFNLDCSTGQDQLTNYAIKYRDKNLADVYMPSAKMNNSALTQSMKQALKNEGWENDKKVQRVVITGSGWKIYKHSLTGKILYRTIPAAAAFKTSEGECKYWNLTFKQVYNGASYENTIVGGVGSIVELSCSNVNN